MCVRQILFRKAKAEGPRRPVASRTNGRGQFVRNGPASWLLRLARRYRGCGGRRVGVSCIYRLLGRLPRRL